MENLKLNKCTATDDSRAKKKRTGLKQNIRSRKTANSCDIQPKLLVDNTVEFACVLHNSI